MTEDPKISQRYRELGREEPSREIDAAILAAAHRATETRPAPLVVPTGRRRWYFPLAAAAIIVLAVAVTVQVERQQPDPEVAVAPVTPPRVPTDEQTVPAERAAEPVKPAAKPERARKAAPPQVFVPDPKAQAPSAQADSRETPAPAAAPPPELRAQRDAAASAARESRRAEGARAMSKVAEPPEKWLERIAELRKQGRHDEADKALAEFRLRYPDYEIPKAMLERVERK